MQDTPSCHTPIHIRSPPIAVSPHQNHNETAREDNASQYTEQGAVADCIDDRLGQERSSECENISHKVIERNAVGRLLRHELGEHRRYRSKHEHATDAEAYV